jgi:hypothetical protein
VRYALGGGRGEQDASGTALGRPKQRDPLDADAVQNRDEVLHPQVEEVLVGGNLI